MSIKSIVEMRDLAKYDLRPSYCFPVQEPEVVCAFTERIRSTFNWLELANDQRIEKWLAAAGGVITEPYRSENELGATCYTHEKIIPTFRPPRYGRACVIETRYLVEEESPNWDCQGLVDVKGIGVENGHRPNLDFHATGLLALPAAILELVHEQLLNRVFQRAGLDVRCIASFGIVKLGFDYLDGYLGRPIPAVALVRESHIRPPHNVEQPTRHSDVEHAKVVIEDTLNRFGVSSASPKEGIQFFTGSKCEVACTINGRSTDHVKPHHWKKFLETHEFSSTQTICINNLQLAEPVSVNPVKARIVDLSQFFVTEKYDHPIVVLVKDRPLNLGMLKKVDERSQPDPRLRVKNRGFGGIDSPEDIFRWAKLDSAKVGSLKSTKNTGPLVFALFLAKEFVEGRLNSNRLIKRIQDAVDDALPVI